MANAVVQLQLRLNAALSDAVQVSDTTMSNLYTAAGYKKYLIEQAFEP